MKATLRRNFYVTIGSGACEACSATWDLATNSTFALAPTKTTENPDRVGLSQELPDANWLLASSPALITRTLTLVPLCGDSLFRNFHEFVLHRLFHVNTSDEQRIVLDKKGNAIPVRSCGGPYGCETSRLPHFLDNRLTDGSEVVNLTRQQAALFPQEDFWYSFLLEVESTPGPYCGWKD
jgi:hypothetical protein